MNPTDLFDKEFPFKEWLKYGAKIGENLERDIKAHINEHYNLKSKSILKDEVERGRKKDFEFLKEMYECSQKLLEKQDIIALGHLNKMIKDWKDELSISP